MVESCRRGSTTHCSGEGHADDGYLCIYVTNEGRVKEPKSLNFEGGFLERGAGPHGFAAFWTVTGTAPTEAWAETDWTVTPN